MRITKSSCKESELSRKWKRKPIEEKLSQSDFLFQNELQILSKISEKYFCFSVLLSLLFWRDPLNKPVQRSFSSDDFHVLFCLSPFYSVAHHISNKNSSRNNTYSTAAMTKKLPQSGYVAYTDWHHVRSAFVCYINYTPLLQQTWSVSHAS